MRNSLMKDLQLVTHKLLLERATIILDKQDKIAS